jgi:hypothetical protein
MQSGGSVVAVGTLAYRSDAHPRKNEETEVPDFVARVRVSVEFITPAMAARWLLKDTHNRPKKMGRVEAIQRDIEEGHFDLNGETIVFADDVHGKEILSNGAHRLTAIAQSTGPGVWSVVVRGVLLRTQETVDSGVARTSGDMLHLRGEANSNVLAAALLHVYVFTERGYFGYTGGGQHVTKTELAMTLQNNPGIHDSMNFAKTCKTVVASGGLIVAAHYLTSRLDAGDAEYFFNRLGDGQGLVLGDPILTLRNVLLKDRTVPVSMLPRRRAAIIVRAWNAYRAGERLTKFQWTGQDAFPRPQ